MNRIGQILPVAVITVVSLGMNAASAADRYGYSRISQSARMENAANDAAITSNVKSRLLSDENLRSLGIDVTTLDGVVTLMGSVNSPSERRYAASLARETDGVHGVQNQLRISQK